MSHSDAGGGGGESEDAVSVLAFVVVFLLGLRLPDRSPDLPAKRDFLSAIMVVLPAARGLPSSWIVFSSSVCRSLCTTVASFRTQHKGRVSPDEGYPSRRMTLVDVALAGLIQAPSRVQRQ